MGVATAAVAVVALVPVVASGAPSPLPGDGAQRWVGTATGALAVPATAAAVPADRRTDVVVSLAMRDRAGLDALLVRQRTPGSADFHRWLTPAQFTARFAPPAADAAAVVGYLRDHGFTGVSTAPNRLAVTATGTAADAQAAFRTTLRTARVDGRQVTANTTPALVPERLGGIVQSVLGLSDVAYRTQSIRHPLTTAAAPSGVDPQPQVVRGLYPKELATAYNAGSTPTGSRTAIAVIAAGDQTQTVTDLRTAEANQGLPQVPVTPVYVGTRGPVGDPTEWDLDAQTSTGVAGSVSQLYLYTATNLSSSALYGAYSRFATDNLAKGGSASLGLCDEYAAQGGVATATDQVFAQAMSQGQTFFASSGDQGSSCPNPTRSGPQTSYPASSRYVVGVGGTRLDVGSNGQYGSETTWNGTGGGASTIEARPSWQANATRAIGNVRAVPDVAADADPASGARIWINGREGQVGGTSLSSPLWLGVWARLETAASNGIGSAAPLLYGLYDKANPAGSAIRTTPGFHDVTTGSNGAYSAVPGYDQTTGIGTPDITALAAALAGAGGGGGGGGGGGAAAKRIVGKGSGRCLDVGGASQDDGAAVILYDCNGQPNQTWTPSEGRLLVSSSNKCLDVRGVGKTDGTQVWQYTCIDGNVAQQWVIRADGTIVNPNSGKCLDAVKKGTANGTGLQIWGCNPNATTGSNQRWTLAPA